MAISVPPQANQALFEFAPHARQDTELLTQLGFIPGLKEVLMLRQVHALEHATVWVLNDPACSRHSHRYGQIGGMSTDQGFYLYGSVEAGDLQRAVQVALHRLVHGDWDLAVHPRCGTNLSVAMMLTVGLALGIHWFIPKGPLAPLLGFGIAATAAAQLTPDLGAIAQQYITTAIPFNLSIRSITSRTDLQGHPVHFVAVQWVEAAE